MSYFYCSGSVAPTVQNLPSGFYLLEGHFESDFSDDAFYFPKMDVPMIYEKDRNQAAVFYYDQTSHFWNMTYLNYGCDDPKDPERYVTLPTQPMYLSTAANASGPAEKLIYTTVVACYGGVPPRQLVLMSDGTLCEQGNPKNVVGLAAYSQGEFYLNKDDGTYPSPAVNCTFWKAINMNSKAPSASGSYVVKVYLQPDLSDTPMYLGFNRNDNTLKISGTKNTLWYYDKASATMAVQPELRKIPQPQDAVWLQTSPQGGIVTANTTQNNALQFLFPSDNTIGAFLPFGPSAWIRSIEGQLQLPVFGNQGAVTIAGINIYVQYVPFQVPSNYDVLKSLLVEVTDKTDPNYIACQGGPGAPDTQVCFLNHSKDNPNIPALPQVSYNPLECFGYNRAAVGAPGATLTGPNSGLRRVGADPMLYLTAPNDAMQLNQMQVSTCLQDDCGCAGQNPDTCKTDPSGYCKCPDSGHQNDICGFQCLPGLEAHRLDDCVYDPLHDIYLSHYQCFPRVIVGTMDDKKVRGCCSYAGPAVKQPNGPTFNTMQACYEKFMSQCPPGYEYHGNLDRPGCYRVRDWTTTQTSSNHCQSVTEKCGPWDATWSNSCTGNCDGGCNCYCADRSIVPPYGYYCDNGGHSDKFTRAPHWNNPQWIQNKSSAPLQLTNDSVNFRFGDRTCGNPNLLDNYCVIGTTGYGPDYIGPPGVPQCTNT